MHIVHVHKSYVDIVPFNRFIVHDILVDIYKKKKKDRISYPNGKIHIGEKFNWSLHGPP